MNYITKKMSHIKESIISHYLFIEIKQRAKILTWQIHIISTSHEIPVQYGMNYSSILPGFADVVKVINSEIRNQWI